MFCLSIEILFFFFSQFRCVKSDLCCWVDESSCIKIHSRNTTCANATSWTHQNHWKSLALSQRVVHQVQSEPKQKLPEACSNALNMYLFLTSTHPCSRNSGKVFLYNFCHVKLPFGNSKQFIWPIILDIPSFTPKTHKLLKNKQLFDNTKQGYLAV